MTGVFDTVSDLCNGLSSCVFEVTSDILGDSCGNNDFNVLDAHGKCNCK